MGDNRWLKNSFVYLIILVAALALFFNYFNNQQNAPNDKDIYSVLNDAKAGQVDSIDAQSGSNDLVVTYKANKTKFRSRL
jgi:cell division protease FtsH